MKVIGIYTLSVISALLIFVFGGMLSKLIIPAIHVTKVANEQRRLINAGDYCIRHAETIIGQLSDTTAVPITTLGVPDMPTQPGIPGSQISIRPSDSSSFVLILSDASETILEWRSSNRRVVTNSQYSVTQHNQVISHYAGTACIVLSVLTLIGGYLIGERVRRSAG